MALRKTMSSDTNKMRLTTAKQNELMAKPMISKPKRPEPSKWCTDNTSKHTVIAPKKAAKDTPKPPKPNASTITTPKAAPLEVPIRLGSAKGLANKACIAAPATAKDMPTIKATKTRGQRKIVGDEQIAQVYFNVLLREDPSQEAPIDVREIWHFVRPASGDGTWKLDGIQQVAGDDHRSLDAVADGHDGRVELGGVDLLDGQHIGHIGLNGGQMRGPTGHKLRVLVHCEHILTHLVEGGGHGPAETAQSDDQHAFVAARFCCHDDGPLYVRLLGAD